MSEIILPTATNTISDKQPAKMLVVLMINTVLVDRLFVANPESKKHSTHRRYINQGYKHIKNFIAFECHTVHEHRVYLRPYVREFLDYLRNKDSISIAIWSDEMPRNYKPVLEELFSHPQGIAVKLSKSDFTCKKSKSDFTSKKSKKKMDLNTLWNTKNVKKDHFNQKNTVIISSKSKKGLILQKENCICITDYNASEHDSDQELNILQSKLDEISRQLQPENDIRELIHIRSLDKTSSKE
ncbi:hypothetical protein HDV02_005004 [Globomyces sp. JEL0801]|nr:hypothetical protein HDV02_005004 [Globomyces sp. JEL0801]